MTDPNHVVSASYELAQIADIGMEEHHSFRHRGWGMIAAAGLLVPSFWCLFTVIVEGNWGVLATHLGLAILFGLLFGTLFLYGVLASRRIAWLRLTCNGMEKMIPLPGIEKSQLENALGARRASKAPPW